MGQVYIINNITTNISKKNPLNVNLYDTQYR